MQRGSELGRRAGGDVVTSAFGTAMSSGMAWFDMMMRFQQEMQRASLQSLSSYSPISDTRITGELPRQSEGAQVVPVGEERLNVATSTVQGETTRIRRRVISQPVEQQIVLRDEKVVVERRSPTSAKSEPDVLTETVVEMSDSRQVPKVWKSLHVAQEVVLRKEVTERTEKVRETVRRDVIDVEHDRHAIEAPDQESDKLVALLPPRRESNDDQRKPAKAEASDSKPQDDQQKGKHDEQQAKDANPSSQPGARKS